MLRVAFRGHLGGAFIISIAVVATYLSTWVGRLGLAVVNRRLNRKARLRHLETLTSDEKAYLVPYIHDGKNTMNYLAQDGIASGLVQKGILYAPSSLGSMLSGFAYNLQPWARDELERNPSLLEGASLRSPEQGDGFIHPGNRY